MLILTRRVSEGIKIGDDISITILGVDGCSVKVGISAPKDVSVHRNEIYNRLQNGGKKEKGNVEVPQESLQTFESFPSLKYIEDIEEWLYKEYGTINPGAVALKKLLKLKPIQQEEGNEDE